MNHEHNLDAAGSDFDKWLDWNGAADSINSVSDTDTYANEHNLKPVALSIIPISPTATVLSDSLPSATKSHTYTASSVTGPITPSHSLGSPELCIASDFRLSGDTLRDDSSIIRSGNLKRKLSADEDAIEHNGKVPRAKVGASKRPHNVIEKRYRANLNDKIAELRDSVPSLRVLQQARERGNTGAASDDEDPDGPTPSGKLNKASILTKAVEYIRHLEFRNNRLEVENRSLRERLQILDKVLTKGGSSVERVNAFTTDKVIENSSPKPESKPAPAPKEENKQSSTESVSDPPNWRRARLEQSQEHYGHIYQNPSERPRLGGKWTSRIMLGSLAGLMVVEGFSEHDQGSDSREKGLFGIPLEILDGWTFLRSPRIYLATFGDYCRSGGILPLIKGFMAISILAFFIFAYLFNSRPHPQRQEEKELQEEPQAARPASPIEVRRRAWSTSMQALNLPHHSFFPEWIAVTSEWINYTIRYIIGPTAFTKITGRSAEDEIARIKAWDIAIDAQLAGGDTEVSRSRVTLTIIGSGTLPQTPMRLMQKALHLRVILWNVGVPGTSSARLANFVATYLADYQWRRARALHERLSARDADRLPGYLNYLLQMDCDEVFTDQVTQRAVNMMYDRPTSEYAENGLMDVVAEDYAIRSPLDAVAAWRSTYALQEALDTALQNTDCPDLIREHVQASLEIAPPGSTAETRALAVHAVLSPGRRSAFYTKAKDAMSITPQSFAANNTNTQPIMTLFIDSSTPASARPEIKACLRCAEVMLTLEQQRDIPKAIAMTAALGDTLDGSTTILTIAALYFVLSKLYRANGPLAVASPCALVASRLGDHLNIQQQSINVSTPKGLGKAIMLLRGIWNLSPPRSPVGTTSRRYSMVSNDTGYASLSEVDDVGLSLTPMKI